MTPAAITLTVFLIALALFIADFLPMGISTLHLNSRRRPNFIGFSENAVFANINGVSAVGGDAASKPSLFYRIAD